MKTIFDLMMGDGSSPDEIVKAVKHLCHLEFCLRADMKTADPAKVGTYESRIEECKSLRDQFRPKMTADMWAQVPKMNEYKNSIITETIIRKPQERISNHELF